MKIGGVQAGLNAVYYIVSKLNETGQEKIMNDIIQEVEARNLLRDIQEKDRIDKWLIRSMVAEGTEAVEATRIVLNLPLTGGK